MTNKNKEEGDAPNKLEVNVVKKLLILAAVGLKLGRKILEKVESMEVSLDIIAREAERQAEKGE